MNKPRLPGDDKLPGEESISAKWADLVNAMRESDPLDRAATDGSVRSVDDSHFASHAVEAPIPSHDPLEMEERAATQARGRLFTGIAILMVGLLWAAGAAWALIPGLAPVAAASSLLTVAAVATPLLLLFILWAIVARRSADPVMRWTDYTQGVAERADRSLEYLAAAEARLHQAYSALDQQSLNSSLLSEGSAETLLAAARRIEAQSNSAEKALRSSGDAASEALALVNAIDQSVPGLESRLTGLSRTLGQSSAELARQGGVLEEQLRNAAIVAEEARLQITQSHDATVDRLGSLQEATRATSDELNAMADLASARVELILEHARGAMTTARDGLQQHMAALTALGEQGDRSTAHVQLLAEAVDGVARRIGALEQDSDGGQARIASHLSALSAQAERVGGALQTSNQGAAHLIERVETLLLALDSNIREIDESLPAALGRFDLRLSATEAKLGEAAALAEGMAGTADAAARHLEQASDTLIAQSQAVEASIRAGDSSVARQTAEIAIMRAALDESAAAMAQIVETRAPQLVATMARVREEAEQSARHAEDAINTIVARTTDALARGSGAALDNAISKKVNSQIAQIAEIADNAVKSAHRATDHLMREMMAITDTATDLESRMAQARQIEDARGRDHIAERSAQIIAALNDSAIDVTKWLNQDIGQKEWASYLSGDKSLFSRRAVRLLSGGDLKQVHARYEIDPAFREHVNRYVEEFEQMLADVLEARRGHSLAIALLSSDLGKLYVALAQAIERLRVA
ncbi:hypothetical protein LWE61_10285 [Sphingobium sufflavum]|uniref:hypothetical protein n=1 Tax=Sphingobium sufflavum TaxID=1129547 RepID=UPI001F18F48D|nr:hypothetical protein [Sphingobium sufflavum]MCE7796945.1 hypothetical protein [Sphingobium sufflavum]